MYLLVSINLYFTKTHDWVTISFIPTIQWIQTSDIFWSSAALCLSFDITLCFFYITQLFMICGLRRHNKTENAFQILDRHKKSYFKTIFENSKVSFFQQLSDERQFNNKSQQWVESQQWVKSQHRWPKRQQRYLTVKNMTRVNIARKSLVGPRFAPKNDSGAQQELVKGWKYCEKLQFFITRPEAMDGVIINFVTMKASVVVFSKLP